MKRKLMIAVCLGCLTWRASGDLITATNLLPVDYTATAPISYFGGLIVFSGLSLNTFSTNTLPPTSGFIDINYTAVATMSNLLSQFTASDVGIERITFNNTSGTTNFYDTEMLQMNISGGTLPGGVLIRESPTLASTGQMMIISLNDGTYQIHGFFDVFTELSFNGGSSWFANDGGPAHLVIIPEPTSVALFALGLTGLVGLRRRHQ